MTIDFNQIPDDRSRRPTRTIEVVRCTDGEQVERDDCVAVEEPLEIRLGHTFLGQPAERSVSVTMRTPGADRELAIGFLYGESVIKSADDVEDIEFCGDQSDDQSEKEVTNIIRVVVGDGVEVDMASLQRNFYTTSSCGVCGKASLEALEIKDCQAMDPGDFSVAPAVIQGLTNELRSAQKVFDDTGGIHAAGLFDEGGKIIALREDVGRHNAMDKLIGSRLLADALPATRSIAVLSGRASFELLQKALMAQIPIVVAVGAPSSLAVDLAREFGITLIGFARDNRFNIYTHRQRIELENPRS